MAKFEPPAPPYLGPPAHFSSGNNRPITRIVMHATVSPCVKGGARDIARYFRSQAAGGSAQYVVDPGEVIQACYDSVIAWGAPPNPHSLHIELCDPMTGPGRRWHDNAHQSMLDHAAELTAQLCLAYDVPIHRIDVADLKAGRHGICGHADVSDAWHQSDHWDPGPAFPWPEFMHRVRRAAALLQDAPAAKPTPGEVTRERATPTRVTRARRLLRRALAKRDGIHDKRAIRAALRDLPKR